MPDGERRLAAIMFTDMVGYTALGQRDEALSLSLVEEQRKLIRPILFRHNGREVKTMGDAFLVEFPSALDAATCALDIQRAIREFNLPFPAERRIHLRVGLHLGDVVESDGDISGDAVNVASRIEPLAEDEGVCLTRQVYDQVQNKLDVPLASIGERKLKNVSEPLEIFKMVFAWQRLTPPRRTPALSPNRIAILPFANFSPDPGDEYFADGMTEEIISTVSGISGFSVISRTSVMGYKGTSKKVGEIGRELDVGSVLEGSFRKAGNRIRVTTQLIDVARDRHLWAQSYDRTLDDIFAVQSDVARQVADALKVKVLSSEMERIGRKPTESTTAYTLYLRGRYLWNKRGGEKGIEDVRKAAECFERAVAEDAAFALGYIGQADCCIVLRSNFLLEPEANLEKAGTMVAKALELDPGLAEAHATKGFVLQGEYKVQEAEEEFRKSIELKPGYATVHQWYYLLLRYQQRWDEALEQIEKALELDPLSLIINLNHGNYYFIRREYGKALELFRRATELDPGFASAHWGMAYCYGRLKMYDDMRRKYATFVDLLQNSYPLIRVVADAEIAYLEDDRQALRRLLPELEAQIQETMSDAYSIACFHFYLGEDDKGFEWLERSYSGREGSLLGMKFDCDLDRVRTDPRYLDLLKRLGLN